MDIELIKLFNDPTVANMQDADILVWLQADITISQDDQLYTWSGVLDNFANNYPTNGLTQMQAFAPISLMQSAPGFPELDALLTTGCQISLPAFQFTALNTPGLNADQTAIIRAIAKIGQPVTAKLWFTRHIAALPLLADVAAARAQYAVHQQIELAFSSILNAMINDERTTVTQLKTAFVAAFGT